MKKLLLLALLPTFCFAGQITQTTPELQAILDINEYCNTIKCHCTNVFEVGTADAWTDCTNLVTIADETSGGLTTLGVDTASLTVSKDGIYNFGGCVHVQNNTGGGFTDIMVLTRLTDNGAEMRCSQRGFTEDVKRGGEDVLSYNGTASLQSNDVVKLQYFTNNADVEFFSNTNFTEQVAFTLWLTYCGPDSNGD